MKPPKDYPMTAYVTHMQDGKIRFYYVKYRHYGQSLACSSDVACGNGFPASRTTFPKSQVGEVQEADHYKKEFARHEFYIVTTDPNPLPARALVIKAMRDKADKINTAWNTLLEQAAKLETETFPKSNV